MAVTMIPFGEIEFHPEIKNPREELKDIPDLILSIKAVGLQTPITVLSRDDKYYLIVGFRRYEAIKQIREEDTAAFRRIEVRRFKGSLAEAQVLNLTENIQRSELTISEIANGVETLLNHGYKQKEIAARIGKSQTWVSNAMQFRRRAVPALKEAVSKGKISYGFGRTIASLPDKQQRERIEEVIETLSGEGKQQGTRVGDRSAEAKVRKEVRELSGRVIRPHTMEIRDEVRRLKGVGQETTMNNFDAGILTALTWVLGEKKTLEQLSSS